MNAQPALTSSDNSITTLYQLLLLLVTMAEKAPTASEALANLKQQLTCPDCLDRYTQPRTCTALSPSCLSKLSYAPPSASPGRQAIYCLPCVPPDHTATQQRSDLSGFQSAFLINNFLELHGLLEKVSWSQQNI